MKAQKQAKNQGSNTMVDKAGKSSTNKPRSDSKAKADNKRGRAASKNKDTGRSSKSRDAGKSTDRKGSSSKAKDKTTNKAQDKKKGKKDESKDEEEEVAAGLQPTRALNAYMFFSNEMIPKIKVDEGLSHKDAMSRSGQMWQQMTDDDKKPYNDKHEKDVKRYEKQKKELKEKGYFIMADGSKSTDHQVPAKKKRGSSKKRTQDKSAATGGKRKSVMDKSMRSDKKAGATGKKGKKPAANTKKTDDDLDIESDGEEQEASVQESD